MLPTLTHFKILKMSSTGIFSMVIELAKVTHEKFISLIIADAVLC